MYTMLPFWLAKKNAVYGASGTGEQFVGSFLSSPRSDFTFLWGFNRTQHSLKLISLPTCIIDSVSSHSASLYLRSIDSGLACHSKLRHSIRISIHCPSWLRYYIRSIRYHGWALCEQAVVLFGMMMSTPALSQHTKSLNSKFTSILPYVHIQMQDIVSLVECIHLPTHPTSFKT